MKGVKGMDILAIIVCILAGLFIGFIIGYQCARYKYETNYRGMRKHAHLKL